MIFSHDYIKSQSLFDIWSFEHLKDGGIFFLIYKKIRNINKLKKNDILFFIIFHTLFEIYENSPKAIANNLWGSTEYKGDSFLNSIGDLLSFMSGIYLMYKLRKKNIYLFLLICEIILFLFLKKDTPILNYHKYIMNFISKKNNIKK